MIACEQNWQMHHQEFVIKMSFDSQRTCTN
jgi:hypothetical protein